MNLAGLEKIIETHQGTDWQESLDSRRSIDESPGPTRFQIAHEEMEFDPDPDAQQCEGDLNYQPVFLNRSFLIAYRS